MNDIKSVIYVLTLIFEVVTFRHIHVEPEPANF